jgi:acyl carrier protein
MELRRKLADLLSANGLLTREQIDDPNFSLFGSGVLSSIDLLNIVLEAETFLGFSLEEKYLNLENFDSIAAIEHLVHVVREERERAVAATNDLAMGNS